MIRAALLTIASLTSLTACTAATAAQPSSAYLAAILLPGQHVPPASAQFVQHATQQALFREKSKISVERYPRLALSPVARVQGANRAALREPAGDAYLGAVEVYPWSDGALYQLYTAPGQVSDIALQPGEGLVSVAAGDTARWVIGDTTSGSGAVRRTHILVKPSAAGLKTNLVIATDRRVYHVEVASTARTAMASISWAYSDDPLLALRGGSPTLEQPVAAGVAVDALNFDYHIEGDNAPWRPLRAFDDGRQVFIEFPSQLGEAPPLFVRGQSGRAELVNYRIRGRYYVVDRLFTAAELRLGERRQQVVRITRDSRRGS